MSKISELSDGGSLLPTDFLIAVRSGGNVKVQADQTEFDRIRLGDNEKIELGNSQDLQIYSDGASGIIQQVGTGILLLKGQDFYVQNDASENFIRAETDGAVRLYYNNLTRLDTTSSGIDVTGSVTADGLTVDSGTATPFITLTRSGTYSGISFHQTISNVTGAGADLAFYSTDNNTGFYWQTTNGSGTTANALILDPDQNVSIPNGNLDVTGNITQNTGDLLYAGGGNWDISHTTASQNIILRTTPSGGNPTQRMRVSHNGDVSLYEDSGNTPKLFWDASAESLGIGDQSPTNGNLTIRAASTIGTKNGHIMLTGDSASVGQGPQIAFSESGNGSNWVGGTIGFTRTGGSGVGDLLFSTRQSAGDANTAATEVLRLTSTGALLLHPNNISRGLKITSGTTEAIGSDTIYDTIAASYGKHIFKTDGVERMRISSGSVSVGTTDDAPGVADTNVGVALNSGRVFASAEADYSLNLNRNTSDGDILRFRKDGTTIGSLGVGNSDDLYIGTADTGLVFQDNEIIAPWNPSTNALHDATISIGYSDRRFKDLYLSGTANLNFIKHSETIYPTTDAAVDVGTSSKRYRNLYLSSGVIAGPTTASNVGSASNFSVSNGDIQLTLERTTQAAGWGGIGANSSNALHVYNESTQKVLQVNQTDGSIQFPQSTSAGIYLGGTAAANKISDFETGTFTPVMENVTGWSGSSGVSGNYTKIGNTVHVFISMTSNVALTGTPTNKITGLPFSSDLNERCSNVSISRMFGIGLTTTDYIAGVTLSEINFSYVNGDNNVNNLTHSGSTLRITLSATYTTAA